MAVPEQTPYEEYIANGVSTRFPLGFICEDSKYLIIKIDDQEVLPSEWYLDQQDVIFHIAPKDKSVISIKRNTPLSRSTKYSLYDNSFRPQTINEDMDSVWLKMQELLVEKNLLEIKTSKDDDFLKEFLMQVITDAGLQMDQLRELFDSKNYVYDQLIYALKNAIDTAAAAGAGKNGWTADLVIYKGGTQAGFNDKTQEKTFSLKDAGGIGGGNNDTDALLSAINQSSQVLLNTDQSAIRQIRVKKSVTLTGPAAELVQDIPNQHTIITNFDKGTPENNAGLMIKGLRFINMLFGAMPPATSDDFGALKIRSGDGAVSAFNRFKNTENALIASCAEGKSGVPGFGSRDVLSIGDYVEGARRFAFQNFQANFTKIIGLSTHNNGDNNAEDFGGTNNGGYNIGVRLSGLSRGVTLVANSIRDKVNGISFQTGNINSIISSTYFENSRDNTINVSTNNQALGGMHLMSALLIKNAGAAAVRMRYLGNSIFSGLIDTTASHGIDALSSVSGENHYKLVFAKGSGAIPAVDTIIMQGNVTAKLVQVFAANRLPAAAGQPMPESGEILVKTVSGGLFTAADLTAGITATVTRVYAAEGHNRIDATVLNANGNSLRLGTDSNLVDLLSSDCKASDVLISGNFNLCSLVLSDNATSSYPIISGENNVVLITDNRKIATQISLNITGRNNIVIGNFRGRLLVDGSDNYIDVICNRVSVSGNNNSIGGDCTRIDNTGIDNKLTRLKRGSVQNTVTLTTDSTGIATVQHGLIGTAKTIAADVINPDELLHAKVVNVAATAATFTVKIWGADGSAAAEKDIMLSYSASI